MYQSKKSGEWCPAKAATKEWSIDWRKPNPGMLNFAMKTFAIEPGRTLMVGDMKEDSGAAAAAGVEFINADTFFGR